MNLIFVTQVLDSADPVLGFTVRWIEALGERFERVAVIANRVVWPPPDLGPRIKVLSLGKERGEGWLRRGLAYQVALFRLSTGFRPDALLAHMCPIYLTSAAPVTKILQIPTLLWFAHPRDSLSLRMAEASAAVVLTSLPGAYPRPSPKVRVIGQAIDVGSIAFSPPNAHAGKVRLLALGRTSPGKMLDVAMQATAVARRTGMDVRLRIVGPSTTGLEQRYRNELGTRILSLGVGEFVTLEPGVPWSRIPELLRESDALVSAAAAGYGDKVVLESMAAGRPVLASNPVFASILGSLPVRLSFRQGDSEDLAHRIAELGATGPSLREEMGRILRRRVEEEHSLDQWADRIAEIVKEARRQKRVPT
jgi:glycosyltransferase involved in cell wall biosynthesis